MKRVEKIVNAVTEISNNATSIVEGTSKVKQGSARQEIDMLSDNKLSKNIRPIIVIWGLFLFTFYMVSNVFFEVDFDKEIKDTIFWLVMLSVGFYFPARSVEKLLRKRK